MEAFLLSTGIVALAEMGDKTQLLSLVLAARFRKPWPIIWGILVATLLNHALAGAVGAWVAQAMGPDLLRWVHVAFTDSFLATHRVWGGPIPGGEDAYVREWAKAGELVGVSDPPRSVAELDAQMAGFAPVLQRSEASERTVRFIRQAPLPLPARPPYGVLFAGAVATLPSEQRRLLGLPPVPLAVARPAVGALLGALGAILGRQSPSQRNARRRVARLDVA